MNKNKEEQLGWIKGEFKRRVDVKFRKGAREHKQNLMDIDLLEEACMEIIDATVYLLLEIKRRKKI